MSISRKRAQEYAEELLQTPSAHLAVTLSRGKSGTTLAYKGRALTRCHSTRIGMWGAAFMAEALGVELPEMGRSVKARVSTGALWRAIAISSLDLRKREARIVLHRFLQEAATQRARGTGANND